jgi:hypothetical protein
VTLCPRLSLPPGVDERFGAELGTFAVDATEVPIAIPSWLGVHKQQFSNYKNAITAKFQVLAHVADAVYKVSDAFAGAITDDSLFMAAGGADRMPMFSRLLADRGYRNVHAEMATRSGTAEVPHFRKRGEAQLAGEASERDAHVASVRMVIERLIGRAKSAWPWIMHRMPTGYLDMHTSAFRVCCLLTNFFPPLTDATAGGLSLEPAPKRRRKGGAAAPAELDALRDDEVGDGVESESEAEGDA